MTTNLEHFISEHAGNRLSRIDSIEMEFEGPYPLDRYAKVSVTYLVFHPEEEYVPPSRWRSFKAWVSRVFKRSPK